MTTTDEWFRGKPIQVLEEPETPKKLGYIWDKKEPDESDP
jgi:hypothetical protein